MRQEDILFRTVNELCCHHPRQCPADSALVSAVSIMREHNISSMIVTRDNTPVGIFTDRDLRNKVVAQGIDPTTLQVADIMHTPLQTIDENAPLYQALYQMSRHRIHRLAVIDHNQQLSGILTDSDIIRLQSDSPQQLILEIEQARSVAELKTLHQRIEQLLMHLNQGNAPIRALVRLIAQLNDQILLRLIHLNLADYPDNLSEYFNFMVMGSEGRSEQTLATDQDNAIIISDNADSTTLATIQQFSETLITQLIDIGVPPCPGGIMAKNSAWRRSLQEWQQIFKQWANVPTPENLLAASMFLDFRALHGHPALAQQLQTFVDRTLLENRGLLMRMAQNMLRFRPPLSWFGRLKTQRHGQIKQAIELKKAGIFVLTDGIKALALEAGIHTKNTQQRLNQLAQQAILSPSQTANLTAAFERLVSLRLRTNLTAIAAGQTPSNYLDTATLTQMEKSELRSALETVRWFQSFISQHFNIQLLQN